MATSGSWTTSAARFTVLHDVHTRAVPSVSYLFYSTNVWTWRVAHLLKCIRCYISIDWYRFTIGCFPKLCVIMTNKPQRSTYSAWSWRMLVNHLTIYPRFAFVPRVRFHEHSLADFGRQRKKNQQNKWSALRGHVMLPWFKGWYTDRKIVSCAGMDFRLKDGVVFGHCPMFI